MQRQASSSSTTLSRTNIGVGCHRQLVTWLGTPTRSGAHLPTPAPAVTARCGTVTATSAVPLGNWMTTALCALRFWSTTGSVVFYPMGTMSSSTIPRSAIRNVESGWRVRTMRQRCLTIVHSIFSGTVRSPRCGTRTILMPLLRISKDGILMCFMHQCIPGIRRHFSLIRFRGGGSYG